MYIVGSLWKIAISDNREQGARYPTVEDPEVVLAEFSTLSWAVLVNNTIIVQHANDHF
jgi:hypothetical protein